MRLVPSSQPGPPAQNINTPPFFHKEFIVKVDLAGYIASRQGDVKSLTEGIKPEIVDTMKKLVDFVLEGGETGRSRKDLSPEERANTEMEIPGSALQQLALWQLVLGYRLREEEAKGEYVKLLK